MSLFNKKKPVIIITGYLGSGKTTLLNELLHQETRKFALIVNDMGSINVDAKVLQQNAVKEDDTKLIEMTNGCICCTLRDEFMKQIEEISKLKDIEAVFVEASGISDPASIAEGFLMYNDINRRSNVYLNSIVTVVDADRIYSEFLDKIKSENAEQGNDDDPDIINLVMDQIEFCNTVVLNKCDLINEDQLAEVCGVIRQIQSDAQIIKSVQGKINAEDIITGNKFDYEKVRTSSSFQKALDRENNGVDFKDEYGINSFVYEEKRPFDYNKLMSFIENDYPEELIRAKGYIWFNDDDIHVHLFEQAGRNSSVTEVSNWVAAFPEKEQKDVFKNYPEVLEKWDDKYGDRLNQIVFIGKNYDKDYIVNSLSKCLAE